MSVLDSSSDSATSSDSSQMLKCCNCTTANYVVCTRLVALSSKLATAAAIALMVTVIASALVIAVAKCPTAVLHQKQHQSTIQARNMHSSDMFKNCTLPVSLLDDR